MKSVLFTGLIVLAGVIILLPGCRSSRYAAREAAVSQVVDTRHSFLSAIDSTACTERAGTVEWEWVRIDTVRNDTGVPCVSVSAFRKRVNVSMRNAVAVTDSSVAVRRQSVREHSSFGQEEQRSVQTRLPEWCWIAIVIVIYLLLFYTKRI